MKTEVQASEVVSVETPGLDADTGLRRDAVSPWMVTITSLAASGPAAGVALLIPVMASIAGEAAIFALVVTLVAMAALSNTFAEFAKRIPSAGSLFAWNSAGLGSNFGFIFGWFFVGCYLLVVAQGFSVFGGFTHDYLQTSLSWDIPWWILSGLAILYVVTFAWRGIHISSEAVFALLALEVGVCLALGLWLLIGGDASLSLSVFDPGSSPGGWTAIGLAISFGIVGLVGYEEAATLGEEARDPRRSVGRGLFFAVVFLQLFYIFVGWMMISSYPGGVTAFGADPNAAQTLATDVWRSGGGLITVVLLSSILAFTLSAFNAGTRVIFSLGRVGVLPSAFGQTTRYRTPGAAIVAFVLVAAALCYLLGGFTGPLEAFPYYGFMVAVAFSIIYILTNFALANYIRRYTPGEFSVARHALLPIVAVAGVGYALYRTIHPTPPPPLDNLSWVIAAWAAIGIGLLLYIRSSGRADVDEVGRAFAAEYEETSVSTRR